MPVSGVLLTPQQLKIRNSTSSGAPYSTSYLNSMGNPQLSRPENYLGIQPSRPTATDTSGVYNGGSGSGSGTASGGVAPVAPRYNPADLAAIDQSIGQVNSGIGRLGGQLDVGYRNIDTAYNDAFNGLQQQKATGERNYTTNKNTTAQEYVGSKNTIGSNAGTSLNSLQRLLSSRGAGGSSAATVNAPTAVGRQASIQRAGVGQTFAKNNQALDTNWNDFLGGWNREVEGIGNKRVNERSAMEASVNESKAKLLNNLAQLMSQRSSVLGGNGIAAAQPYLNEVNGLMSRVDQLGLQKPVFQTQAQVYKAPELGAYTVNPNAAPTLEGGPNALTDTISPFLSLLLGKNREQNPLMAV